MLRSAALLTLALAALLIAGSVDCSVSAASSREDESPEGFVPNAFPVVEPGTRDVENRFLPAVIVVVGVPDSLGKIILRGCSGALIDRGVAVTAAHCFCSSRAPEPADTPPLAKATKSKRKKRKAILTRARALQDVVISDITDSRSLCAQVAIVETAVFEKPGEAPWTEPYPGTVLIHPEFEMIVGTKHGTKGVIWDTGDLAVIRLDKPVTLNFQPLALSSSEVKLGDVLVMAGYSANDGSGAVSMVRQFGKNEVTQRLEYETGEVIFGASVARGPKYEAPAHALRGDSGAACVREENPNVLIGIATIGGLTDTGRPISYFTSIHRYKDWLLEIVRRFGSPLDAGVAVPAPDAGS